MILNVMYIANYAGVGVEVGIEVDIEDIAAAGI